jgi:hypothetical protein
MYVVIKILSFFLLFAPNHKKSITLCSKLFFRQPTFLLEMGTYYVVGQQGDQMGLRKYRSKCSPNHFLSKLIHNINQWKMLYKNLSYFNKLPKVNNHPIVENSPNLVTLLASCVLFSNMPVSNFLFRKCQSGLEQGCLSFLGTTNPNGKKCTK